MPQGENPPPPGDRSVGASTGQPIEQDGHTAPNQFPLRL